MPQPAPRALSPLADRMAGALVGQAVGDALGFPVEGEGPEACQAFVRDALGGAAGAYDLARLEAAAKPPFAFGQYSDDTQLARELFASYAERGAFDPADYGRRIGALYASGRVVGPGKTTAQAAERLARGVPWPLASEPTGAATNGSTMRAAPLGLLFWDDPGSLVRAAADQSRMTHRDPRSAAGSIAIAGAAALALEADLHAPAVLDTLADWAGSADAGFATWLRDLSDWLPAPPAEALSFVLRANATAAAEPPTRPGIPSLVTGSVLWSLYAFLRHADDFGAAVRVAIAAGGDTDTTAAMTGALVGARLGLAGVPDAIARRLTDRGALGYDALVALGVAAAGVKDRTMAAGGGAYPPPRR